MFRSKMLVFLKVCMGGLCVWTLLFHLDLTACHPQWVRDFHSGGNCAMCWDFCRYWKETTSNEKFYHIWVIIVSFLYRSASFDFITKFITNKRVKSEREEAAKVCCVQMDDLKSIFDFRNKMEPFAWVKSGREEAPVELWEPSLPS